MTSFIEGKSVLYDVIGGKNVKLCDQIESEDRAARENKIGELVHRMKENGNFEIKLVKQLNANTNKIDLLDRLVRILLLHTMRICGEDYLDDTGAQMALIRVLLDLDSRK